MTSNASVDSASSHVNHLAMPVVTSIFFMWGFMTCLNDILVPHLKAAFDLDYFQAMLIQFAFFGAYFIMGRPASALVGRVGNKNGIVLGLLVAGIGAAGFWLAAEVRVYGVFLATLFLLACGITILQVAANAYVTRLGPEKTASSRLNLSQAFNALGTAVAPVIGGIFILAGSTDAQTAAERLMQARSVQGPYLSLAALMVVLALAVYLLRLPAMRDEVQAADTGHAHESVLRYSHVRNGVLAIFLYVGAEVTIGSLLINYLALPEMGAISHRNATTYVSLYWTGAMVGRFIGSALMMKIAPRRLLTWFALINIVLLAITLSSTGYLAVYTVVAIGLFNSIMFPTLFTLGVARMGPQTNRASGLIIMAIVGGALIPLLAGYLADAVGLHHAFAMPILCYLYIAYYAWRGAQVRRAADGAPA